MKNASNMKLPVGINDFKEVIEGEYLFVDKTLFIKEVINYGAHVTVLTRPNGFGKTFNLSMLHYFLRQDYCGKNLFEGLKISEDVAFCQKHQQQHPVIYISFKDVIGKSYAEAYVCIEKIIRKLYEEHRYLLEGDILHEWDKRRFNKILDQKESKTDVESKTNLTFAIQYLTKFIKKKFNKSPIVLIDDYDAPFLEAYLNGYYKQMVSLIPSMLGAALKDNSYLNKAILMGVIPLSAQSLGDNLNNIFIYSLLGHEYEQSFGFTEEEVKELIFKSEVEISIDSIKEWYGGYQVEGGHEIMCNPFSVSKCLENNGKLESYWVDNNIKINEWISLLIFKSSTYSKRKIEELLQNNIIEIVLEERVLLLDITTSEGDFWSLLLHMGYLKILSMKLHNFGLGWDSKLAIPNKEISEFYVKIMN